MAGTVGRDEHLIGGPFIACAYPSLNAQPHALPWALRPCVYVPVNLTSCCEFVAEIGNAKRGIIMIMM